MDPLIKSQLLYQLSYAPAEAESGYAPLGPKRGYSNANPFRPDRQRAFSGLSSSRKSVSAGRMSRPAAMPADTTACSGAYILLIRTSRPVAIAVGTLSRATLLPGWYAYAGSARGPGGIAARVRRHLAAEKTARWHVDHLTLAAREIHPLAFPGDSECRLMRALAALPGATIPLPGFGASDCAACPAHLIALPPQGRLTEFKQTMARMRQTATPDRD